MESYYEYQAEHGKNALPVGSSRFLGYKVEGNPVPLRVPVSPYFPYFFSLLPRLTAPHCVLLKTPAKYSS